MAALTLEGKFIESHTALRQWLAVWLAATAAAQESQPTASCCRVVDFSSTQHWCACCACPTGIAYYTVCIDTLLYVVPLSFNFDLCLSTNDARLHQVSSVILWNVSDELIWLETPKMSRSGQSFHFFFSIHISFGFRFLHMYIILVFFYFTTNKKKLYPKLAWLLFFSSYDQTNYEENRIEKWRKKRIYKIK